MPFKDKDKNRDYQRKWKELKRKKILASQKCSVCSKEATGYTGKNTKQYKFFCDEHILSEVKKNAKIKSTKHGHSKRSRTYITWGAMKERCLNSNHEHYQYYGACGVKVCDRWMKFENFLADMGERPYGMTLDRKDPSGNYEPDNCRWADSFTQALNKRKPGRHYFK